MEHRGFGGRTLGALAAAAVATFVAQGARADGGANAAVKTTAGHCVHSCSGNAACKGNGNNSCKGKNNCANEGQVPKECSSQTSPDACGKVVDAQKNTQCSWFTK